MGKKLESSHNEQFLLLTQCFQKSSSENASDKTYVRRKVLLSLALNTVAGGQGLESKSFDLHSTLMVLEDTCFTP